MLSKIRNRYHRLLCKDLIRISRNKKKGDYPNFADGDSKSSREIAWGIVNRLECPLNYRQLKGQTVGNLFEKATKIFIQESLELIRHLRPGEWIYSTEQTEISRFYQYEHLSYLKTIFQQDKILISAMGGNYIVKPDIIVARLPVKDEDINQCEPVLKEKDTLATYTPLRFANHEDDVLPILHASISCKWTTRNDRAQNTRTEALNLIRNRKGHLPHVVVVTAEPLPMRIAALALGTGDMDCIYHIALHELKEAVVECDNQDQLEMLNLMVDGRRLRDISDLPFDLSA